MTQRTCSLCENTIIPAYRVLCRHCFNRVPFRVRADLLHAWRDRVLNPALYQEIVAQLRKVEADRKATRETGE